MRKSVAVLCIAIAVFATIVSAVDLVAPAFVMLALWQMAPAAAGAVVPRPPADHFREQTSVVWALVLSRPPPFSARSA